MLFFSRHGLTPGDISTLFVLWAGTAAVLQVPAGALADHLPRRPLLAAAAALRGLGFAVWIAAPGYAGFAVGFALWSVKSALTTGTLEALVYDDLAAAGARSRYGSVIGRAAAVRGVATIAATVAAAPALAAGGYRLVGVLSVAVCAAQVPVALRFPSARALPAPDRLAGWTAYAVLLRGGLSEVRRRPALRRVVVIAGVVPGLVAFDEYLPLLARGTGISDQRVPLLLVLPLIVAVAAAAVVGVRKEWRAVATPLLAMSLLVGVGAATRTPAGVVAVGLGIGAFQLAQIGLEVRVQHAVIGPARATITSVVDVLAEVSALLVFAGFGIGSTWLGTPALVVGDAVLIAAVAAYAGRALNRGSEAGAETRRP